MARGLFWFRRDLRLHDNIGLREARDSVDRLLCLFVVDESHSRWPHRNGDRLQFKLDAVGNLRNAIREAGGELYVRIGDPPTVVEEFCRENRIDVAHWNRTYEPYERTRDESARDRLESDGRTVETHKDQVIHEKDEILTNQGDPYKVFTYYADKWRAGSTADSVPAVDSFETSDEVDPGEIPTLEELGLATNLEDHPWTPRPSAARQRWEQFLREDLVDYDSNRELPARNGTSRLSPHLRFGLISPRRLLEDCRDRFREAERTEGIETFVEELIWRDFYQQVLYNFPEVTDENFKSKYDALEWESHPEWFEAWKTGETGIPIVDAAMRQLNSIGWMHNRLRMIVASFLTKDCFIHWKKGEKYFMNRLLDGDTAANNGGWQWAASTGTDAAPYFRIFNPYSQSEQYDPDGAFIREYCPELEDLDDDAIHAPHRTNPQQLADAGVTLGETYPEPILDHSRRREHALEKFKNID